MREKTRAELITQNLETLKSQRCRTYYSSVIVSIDSRRWWTGDWSRTLASSTWSSLSAYCSKSIAVIRFAYFAATYTVSMDESIPRCRLCAVADAAAFDWTSHACLVDSLDFDWRSILCCDVHHLNEIEKVSWKLHIYYVPQSVCIKVKLIRIFVATHNMNRATWTRTNQRTMQQMKKQNLLAQGSLRIERKNFSSRTKSICYIDYTFAMWFDCTASYCNHVTIATADTGRIQRILDRIYRSEKKFTLARVGACKLVSLANTRKYIFIRHRLFERWANEMSMWTLRSIQWNVKYRANNLWLAYRIERRQGGGKTRTDNRAEVAVVAACCCRFCCRVYCVIYFGWLIHESIVADKICNNDQC